MVSFSLRQRIFFTSPADTLSVSFHLSQFVLFQFSIFRLNAGLRVPIHWAIKSVNDAPVFKPHCFHADGIH